jgi:ribosome-associated translation inhibitor RaiA
MPSRITIHGHTSDAFRTHINDHIMAALGVYDGQITSVVVTVSDENGPQKHGSDDRRFHAVLSLRGGGDVIVDERGEDAYAVVATGADRVKLAVARKLEKKHDKHHGAAENPHHGGIAK